MQCCAQASDCCHCTAMCLACCTWKAACTVPSARVDASILSMPTRIVSSCEAMVLLSCVFVA